jgi:hypothetical protein
MPDTYVAIEPVHSGKRGVIQPGEEVPSTYVDDRNETQKTDFERLLRLGVVEKKTALVAGK